MSTIDKQDLANYLADIQDSDQGGDIKNAMMADFGLPNPRIEQTMIITLHIPVTNLDPRGDTVREGQNMLCEIVAKRGDTGLAKLISFIKAVDIQPRS